MVARAIPSISVNTAPENPVTISFRLLLAIYAIIPLCLALQLVDSAIWGGYLKASLPSSPNHFIFFHILLGTPHIIASAVILSSNAEYMQTYKVKILTMTLALAVIFGIGSQFIPYLVLYVGVALWTVLHVLKQQHGIAMGVCRLKPWQFWSQLLLSVAAGILVYIGIFLKNSLYPDEVVLIKQMTLVLCALLLISTIICHRTVPTLFGKVFLWANASLIFASFYLFAQQYYFLAILVPRLVHDTTAYIFYVAHDYNRHHDKPRNFIYRVAKKMRLSIFVVLPLISFALAFLLQQYGDHYFNMLVQFLFGVEVRKAITLVVLGYLSIMHYYTESFTWKGGSPYRRFISFSR
jgi:hypothetical protein